MKGITNNSGEIPGEVRTSWCDELSTDVVNPNISRQQLSNNNSCSGRVRNKAPTFRQQCYFRRNEIGAVQQLRPRGVVHFRTAPDRADRLAKSRLRNSGAERNSSSDSRHAPLTSALYGSGAEVKFLSAADREAPLVRVSIHQNRRQSELLPSSNMDRQHAVRGSFSPATATCPLVAHVTTRN